MRKPSAHTMKAYRQDFVPGADLMTDGQPAALGDVGQALITWSNLGVGSCWCDCERQ